jgi:peptidoglycan/LPS O-acetylase OafA/YrhL
VNYRAEIDGLRAVAVVPVILFHAGFEWFSGGFIGVDVFFVISGYLITTIIITDMEQGKFSIFNFYERRIRRILPALFFMLFVSTSFAIIIYTPSELKDYGSSLASVALFISNVWFWLQLGYFDTSAELKPLLHTWSLAVEEQYYLLFPLVLLLAWSRGVKFASMILIITFLASLILADFTTTNGLHPKISSGAFFLLPARLWELLAGSLLALFVRSHGHLNSQILNELLSSAGLLMIILSVFFFNSSTPAPSFILLFPVIGTCLVILSATSETLVNKILNLPIIVWVGLISYSAYLWHQPILAFLRFLYSDKLSDTFLIGALILVFALAYISWKFVEAPFRNRDKFSPKAIFVGASLSIFCIASFGIFLDKSNGLLFSYNDFEKNIYRDFIDGEEYTVRKFNDHRGKNFESTSSKKKIILIGDSYAQDLVNALYESGAIDEISLATFYIPSTCGVIFSQKVDRLVNENEFCGKEENSFKNDNLIKLMSETDEVWLASRWKKKFLPLVGESLRNISEINPEIKVFGSKYFEKPLAKDFSEFGLNKWSQVPEIDERQDFEGEKKLLKDIVREQGGFFVDTQRILCSGKDLCAVYDGVGLLSYDGGHLTSYGAKKLGDGISNLVISL